MSIQLDKFLKRNQIIQQNVLYLIREEGKTAIYLTDGRVVTNFTPLKTMAEAFRNIDLLSINKGVAVNEAQIVNVEKGCYTMTDGRVFRGRVRTPGQHSRNSEKVKRHFAQQGSVGEAFYESFAVLDRMPLPFCVVELIYGADGHGIDFVFRYCNKEMERFEGIPLADMKDHTYFEIFPYGDNKWLISFADVALNGGTRILNDYKTGKGNVRVYCFRPCEGFCACALVPL